MNQHSFTWVSPYDPDDARGGWKAMQFHLLRALERGLGPAVRVAPIEEPEQFTAKWFSRIQKKLGIPRQYIYYSDDRLSTYARKVARRLPVDDSKPVVFFGALPFVKCCPKQPYYVYTDGAFFIHYWEYNQDHTHARSDIDRICQAEANFMRRSAGVWCSSQWAADRITKDYALDPGQTRFVGAGPGDVPAPVEPIRYENFLVMIAGDFERKGGRLAVEAVAEARRQGLELGIKFVGARPPPYVLALPFVEWCGWLDLKRQDDRQRFQDVMTRAGAQVLLSRADLTPLAIPEAACYAKATIASAVGGIPEMIMDGLTGWLVGSNPSPVDIAKRLCEVFQNASELRLAGSAAREFHRRVWNWDAVAAATGFASAFPCAPVRG